MKKKLSYHEFIVFMAINLVIVFFAGRIDANSVSQSSQTEKIKKEKNFKKPTASPKLQALE